MLSAEAGKQGFDDSSHQENKGEVRGDAAGRIIFSNLGHGSSQGLILRDFLSQIHGHGLYTLPLREQGRRRHR